MLCEQHQERVSQYIDGELGEQDSENLFGHLGKCRECRMFLRAVLELRSRIQDEILLTRESISVERQPVSFKTVFSFPMVALVLALIAFIGASLISLPNEKSEYRQSALELHNSIFGSQP